MALLDPSIEKLHFYEYDEKKRIEVMRKARLACIMHTKELQPHVELIDAAPGIYELTCRKTFNPKRVWFEVTLVKTYLRDDTKPGRYD